MKRRARHLLVVSLPLVVACGGSNSELPPPPSKVTPPPAPVAQTPPAPAKPAYPPFPKKAVTDSYGDTKVVDDFRALEDPKDPAVVAWSDAENAFARKLLDGDPQRTAIATRVGALMGESSPQWDGLVQKKGNIFALERRPPKQQPYLIVLSTLDSIDKERVLVDPNATDPSGGTSIGWFEPSPDGKKIAVALAKGGAERGDVHVFDVATGKESKDVVDQAEGAGEGMCLAWKADGSGFFYTHAGREPNVPKDGIYQRIYFHKLGTPIEKDSLALGKDSPRIAQWELESSDDGKVTMARMEYGDGDKWDQYILTPAGWKQLATKDDGVKTMKVGSGGELYLLSSKDAPRRKVLKTTVAAPSLEKAEVMIPMGEHVIDAILPTKTRIYAIEGTGGPSRVVAYALVKGKAGPEQALATPDVSSVESLVSLGGDDVAFASESFTSPRAWFKVKGVDGAVTKTALASTTKADFSNVEVSRDECTSKDGTKVPMTILKSKSVKNDSQNPALLWGYGGYGIVIAPRFQAYRLAWLEQGGVYAIANIRGGGELGETWHSAGNLLNKQNVFDDFYACAQRLVESKLTSKDKLAIEGGSNGGLLMGAEITQHPDAFRAVVTRVGIYDMLRVERDPNGTFNVAEYGSVTDPKQFAALYAYSPYHHVKDGTAYPAVMFMTGANDPRVSPYHSRKMVARLQEATSSDRPILLRTSANTGHGIGSPLSAQIEERADIYTFFFRQLGVAVKK